MSKFVVLDYETYYSDEYSLRKMTTQEYIRDPRFKAHGCGIKLGDAPTVWVPHAKLPSVLPKAINGNVVIHHNANFDGAISEWVYGCSPKMYIDTVSLSRAVIGDTLKSHSLDSVAEFLLGQKKGYGLAVSKGMRDLDPETERILAEYCKTDCDLTWGIFKKLIAAFPKKMLPVLDWTTRAFVQPGLFLDADMLRDHLEAVQHGKAVALERAGLDSPEALMSNDKFADALRAFGVEPPTKISPTTGKEAYAFAKTDQGLKDLADHDDPDVQALVAARLSHKSTLEETRTQSYLNASMFGPWPVDYKYAGATNTLRFSGSNGAGGNCLTGDAEVLTPLGWVRFDSLRDGSTVATYNPQTGHIQWERPEVVRLPYSGPLVSIQTQTGTVSGLFTPDHRVPVRKYGAVQYRNKRAEDLVEAGCDYLTPVAGVFQNGADRGSNQFSLALVRLMAAAQADGHIEARGICFEFHKERKKARLKQLLQEAGLPYTVSQGTARPEATKFRVRATDFDFSPFKYLGAWLLSMSSEQLDAFVDETKHWDSHIRGRSWQYFSAKKENCEWLQTACHLTGRSANIQETQNNGGKGILYVCNVKPRDYAVLEAQRNPTTLVNNFTGTVYCLKTEADGFIFRRNGAIACTHNCQNLPRKSPLRSAIMAPKGKLLCASDLSQIELRVVFALAGETEALEVLARGDDLYCWFGSRIYGREITKADKDERQMAKSAVLGLGFGMGVAKFLDYCRTMGVPVDLDMAERVVRLYRETFPGVPKLWRMAEADLAYALNGQAVSFGRLKPEVVVTGHAPLLERCPGFRLPSGHWIKYPGLRKDEDGQWTYTTALGVRKLWGGVVVENVVQALAAEIIKEQLMDVIRYCNLPVRMVTHDELVVEIDKHMADEQMAAVKRVMTQPIKWFPTLPLACEAHYAERYGEAK